MNQRMYDELRDIVEKEIDNIVKKGSLDQNSLCNLDKLIDIVKDIKEVNVGYEDNYSGYRGYIYNDGYSGRMMNNRGSENYNDYGRSNYQYDGYMNYSNMNNRYSGNDEKAHMLSLMEEVMRHASNNEEREEIRKMIGADSLAFLSPDGLMEALKGVNPESYGFCKGCFSGEYPMACPENE